MRKYILFSFFILLLLTACRSFWKSEAPAMHPDNLESQYFDIDPTRDTLLMARQGSLIRVPAGSLEAAKGTRIKLEIKEALTMADMIMAGLTTTAGNEPLASGGMIYVNAPEGISLKNKLEITLPSSHISSKMQLYKGEQTVNEKINWISPTALPVNRQIIASEDGKRLFQASCANCHSIDKDATGPKLAHFPKRFPLENEQSLLYYLHYTEVLHHLQASQRPDSLQYTDESYAALHDHHLDLLLYKCNIHKRFGSMGTAFPGLRDSANMPLLSIFRYIQTESDRLNLPVPSGDDLFNCIDSCKAYMRKTLALDSAAATQNEDIKRLINDNGPLVVENRSFNSPAVTPEMVAANNNIDNDLISPNYLNSSYYQFTIESFGWYNVDMLYDELDGLVEGRLQVDVTNGSIENTVVYLVIPSHSVLQQGGNLKYEGGYGFHYNDGQLPLPANTKGWILALQDGKNGPSYALQDFYIGTDKFNLKLTLTLETSTKKAFNKRMRQLGWDQPAITVDNTANADEIRKKQADLNKLEKRKEGLQKYKPVECDCNCIGDAMPVLLPLESQK